MSWWLLFFMLCSAGPLSAIDVDVEVAHDGHLAIMQKGPSELVADDISVMEVKADGSGNLLYSQGQAANEAESLAITSVGDTFDTKSMRAKAGEESLAITSAGDTFNSKSMRAKVGEAVSDDAHEEEPGYYYPEDYYRQPPQVVTSTQEAQADNGSSLLPNADKPDPFPAESESTIRQIGDGLGQVVYESPFEGAPTGSRHRNNAIRQRLRTQDTALVGIMLLFFVVTITVSCLNVFHFAEDPSPVCFYTKVVNRDRLMCEVPDAEHFLQAFNGQPQNCRLRIIGRTPILNGVRRVLRSLTDQYGRHRRSNRHPWHNSSILFDVALDVSPFITGPGRLEEKQMEILERFIDPDKKNPLEVMVLRKHVDWNDWEDLATNIKQRLRTVGFMGDVELMFENYAEVKIYPNNRWSNFVRSNVTQALVALSIIGGLFWIPYKRCRQKTINVESRFKVNLEPDRYWEIVQNGLSAAEGFQASI